MATQFQFVLRPVETPEVMKVITPETTIAEATEIHREAADVVGTVSPCTGASLAIIHCPVFDTLLQRRESRQPRHHVSSIARAFSQFVVPAL